MAADDGATPLFMAAQKGHLDVVRELVSAGVDKSVKSQWGTPLEIAQRQGHQSVVHFLSARSATALGGKGKGKRGKIPPRGS